MMKLFDLTGRVVLVAGGAGYLARPVCEALAEHGAQVIIGDVREDAVEAAVDAVGKVGLAKGLRLDVGDEASVEDAFKSIPKLDAMVNMAAFSRGKSLEEATAEEWADGIRVTLVGSFLVSRAAARVMGEGSSIVHFSSMYGMVSPDPRMYEGLFPPNPSDYGAAKAGVLQLTRYQAVAWAKRGIRVNAVVPGPFPKTFGQGANAAFVDRLSQRVPLGRVGRAEEIAGAVVYLASSASSFVTGTSLVVDGGWTAW